jgi:hypothetical protein
LEDEDDEDEKDDNEESEGAVDGLGVVDIKGACRCTGLEV